MLKKKIIHYCSTGILWLIITGFVLLKVQDLFLPYFWDEAWSYIPAILEMTEKGPSLLPNAISPQLYRGHPLLFYFITSVWINIFGQKIFIVKSFALLISVLLLFVTYFFAKKYFDKTTAVISVLLLVAQSVFFVQSTLLLPEILLALFTMLCFHFFFARRYFIVVIFLTLALYTKESAVVLWLTLLTALFFVKKSIPISYKLKIAGILSLPAILSALFFFYQKVVVGWFFFPEHISYINSSRFFDRFLSYATYLTIYMGRNLLFIAGLLSVIWFFGRKGTIKSLKKEVLMTLLIFIVGYLIFSAFNFYSPRYLLSILPVFIIVMVWFLDQIPVHPVMKTGVFLFIFINNIYFTVTKREANDHTLGYRDIITVQQKVIHYLQNQQLNDKKIYASFLMAEYLTNNQLGYITNQSKFTQVSQSITPETEYAVFSSEELNSQWYEKAKTNGEVLKKVKQNECWAELYRLHSP